MIITKQTTGQYTIDLDPTIKAAYSISTIVKINSVSVATALPYTATLSEGVHDIYLELSGGSGLYKERRCYLVDETLECQVLTALSELPVSERAKDNTVYQYFLIKESQTNIGDGCACACASLSKIYIDLKSSLEKNCC